MWSWGAEKLFSVVLGKQFVQNVVPIGHNLFIACSQKNTFLFSNKGISKTLKTTFTCFLYIYEHDLVCAVKTGSSTLCAFSPLDPDSLLLEDFQLNQDIVYQMHFSSLSNMLITVGANIKVWRFSLDKQSVFSIPVFYIAHFTTIKPSDLSNNAKTIVFDDKRERMIIPTSKGYQVFSYNGVLLCTKPNLSPFSFCSFSLCLQPSNTSHVQGYNQHSVDLFKKLAMGNSTGTVYLWHRSGVLLNQFSKTKHRIDYLKFLSHEFLLTVENNGEIYVLDVKTGTFAFLLSVPPDTNTFEVYHQGGHLLTVINRNHVTVYNIELLWKLWYRTIEGGVSINRYLSSTFASRVGIVSSTGFFYLISSKNRKLLTTISLKNCCVPISIAYERKWKDNEIFFCTDKNTLEIYTYNGNSFVCRTSFPVYMNNIVIIEAFVEQKWVLCGSTFFGDIILFDLDTLNQIKRFKIGKNPAKHLVWDSKSRSIIFISSETAAIIDMKHFKIKKYSDIGNPDYALVDESILMCTWKTGSSSYYNIMNDFALISSVDFHKSILSVSSSYGLFSLVCSDRSIIFGIPTNAQLLTINLPFQPSAVCLLNSNLDMLVNVNSEIMIVPLRSHLPNSFTSLIQITDDDSNKIDQVFGKKVKIVNNFSSSTKIVITKTKEIENDTVYKIRQQLREEDLYNLSLVDIHSNETEKRKMTQKPLPHNVPIITPYSARGSHKKLDIISEVIRKSDSQAIVQKPMFHFNIGPDGSVSINENNPANITEPDQKSQIKKFRHQSKSKSLCVDSIEDLPSKPRKKYKRRIPKKVEDNNSSIIAPNEEHITPKKLNESVSMLSQFSPEYKVIEPLIPNESYSRKRIEMHVSPVKAPIPVEKRRRSSLPLIKSCL